MNLLGRLLWLAMAGLLPFVMFPAAANPFGPPKQDVFAILALAQAAMILVRLVAAPREAVRRLASVSMAWPLCCWALWNSLVLSAGADSHHGYFPLMESVLGAGLGMGLLLEADSQLGKKMLLIHLCGVGTACFYGALQLAGWDPLDWQFRFAAGAPGATYGNPLFFADGLLAAEVTLVGFAISSRGAWLAVMLTAGAGLGAMLMFTMARGAWIGTVGATGVLVVIAGLRHALRQLVIALVVFVAAGAVVWTTSIYGRAPRMNFVVNQVESLIHPERDEFLGRKLIWRSTALLVMERPILGWGMGGLRTQFTGSQGKLLRTREYMGLNYHMTGHAHQDLLQICAERGLIGAGFIIWLFVTIGATVLTSNASKVVCTVSFAILCGWAIDGLVNGPFHLPPSSMQVWWLGALTTPPNTRKGPSLPSMAGSRILFIGAALLLLSRPFIRDLVSESYLQAGRFALEDGRTEEALVDGLRSVGLEQEERRQHFFLGEVYLRLGRWKLAEGEYRADLTANPGSASAWHNLGVVLLKQGLHGESSTALGRALLLDPKDVEARVLQASIKKASIDPGKNR